MAACSIDLILNAEVSGTTSTNIGSARIVTGSNTTISFRAMFGPSTEATGAIEVKRFTGGSSITELTASGIGLQDVSGSQRTIGDSAVTGSWATGKVDSYSLDFDGTDDYVDLGDLGSLPAEGTIAYWMNPTVVENYRNPLSTNFAGEPESIRFEMYTGGVFKAVINTVAPYTVGDGGTIHQYTSGLSADTWYHVVLTWKQSSNNVKGYLNGSSVFDEGQDSGQWTAPFSDFVIGKGFNDTRDFKGKLDEVAIWNVELSASDVTSLYNSGNGLKANSISSSNLTAYYDMEGGPGASILTDRTGNGNNGTLTNMETGSLLLVDDWYDFYASGSAADVSTLIKGIRVILQ